MRVWQWMCDNMPGDQWVELSASKLAHETGLSIKAVRTAIKVMEKDKTIEVDRRIDPKNGAQMANKIKLLRGMPVINGVEVAVALAVYTKLVGRRLGKSQSVRRFSSYNSVFRSLAHFCNENSMDISIYVHAIFYVMPKPWCKKIFGKYYPDPPLLLNKTKAQMRYDKYASHLEQQYPQFLESDVKLKVKHMVQLMVDLSIDGGEGITALLELGLINKLFATAMGVPQPGVDRALVKQYKQALKELL